MPIFGNGLLGQPQAGLLGGGMPSVPWRQNPMVTMAAFGLLGGRNLNEGLSNVAQTAPAGMVAKSSLQAAMQKRQDDEAAKAAQAAAWNAGMRWKSGGGDWASLSPEDQAALSGNPNIAAQFLPKSPELPNSVQEFQYGQQNPAFNDWMLNNKKAGATNVTTTVNGESGADSKLRGKLSESEGARWSQIQQVGLEASGRAQDFEVMGELLKIAPQGPITGRLAEMFPGFSSAGDALNALVRRIAPTMRAPGSGATSDIEYDGMVKSIPSLSKDPLGNQIIIETMKAKQQIDMERADIVTAYQNEEISAAEARAKLGELNRKSILSPKARALINAAAGVAPDGDLSNVPPGVDAGDWEYMTPEQRALFE